MKNAAKSGLKKPASAGAKRATGASAGSKYKSADEKSRPIASKSDVADRKSESSASRSNLAGKPTVAVRATAADRKSESSASRSNLVDGKPTVGAKGKPTDRNSESIVYKSNVADKKSIRAAEAKSGPARTKSKSKVDTEAKERIIPDKIVPTKLADYLEIMTIAVFQAGMSWAMVLNKLDDYRRAFAGYEPDVVSKFNDEQIAQIIESAKILRSEKKIKGTVENARMMLEMADKYGSFQNYLRSFDSFEQLSNDIRKRFKYMGELSVYYFLFRVGEPVPDFEKWIVTIDGEHPRMREMVEKDQRREDRSGR